MDLRRPPEIASGRAAIEEHLLSVFNGHRERIMGEVVGILGRSRMARRVREPGSDAQGTVGLLKALEEELRGRRTATRGFWLETLFPSLIERGVTLVDIARTSTRIQIAISIILVTELHPNLQKEAGEWLAQFFSGLQAEITRECLKSTPPPSE